MVVVGVVALTAFLAPCWIVKARGPVRDHQVVRELAAVHGRSQLFVVVGTDSRQSIRAEAGDGYGREGAVTTPWADVVMLVRVDAGGHRARIMSLPRELLVDVDGEQKLGATLESGGPGGVVRAVRRATGLVPNHYVQLDFLALVRLVDHLGGVTVDVPAPARDVMTGLDLAGGPQQLDGAQALAYVRSRAYEEQRDGAWQPLDDGDLGRIGRQHRLLQAIAAKRASMPSLEQLWAARDLARHVTVDARLSVRDLLRLGESLASAPLEDTDVSTLPSAPLLGEDEILSPFPPAHAGAVSYLVPSQPAASRALARFAGIGA